MLHRKHELTPIVRGVAPITYADHIEGSGKALFKKASELDLEGIVAKDGRAPYEPHRSTWFKIRNRNYSQLAGREELFERERHAVPVPGWHTCALAASAAVGR
jgi:ATP-dependent DNA ligase